MKVSVKKQKIKELNFYGITNVGFMKAFHHRVKKEIKTSILVAFVSLKVTDLSSMLHTLRTDTWHA